MNTHWKIPIVCLQLLLVLGLLLGTHATVKADQFDEANAAYLAGNYQKAFRIFKPLAEEGSAEAQYNLGSMYFFGQGLPQDYKEARKWYRKATEQGNANAQYQLGFMYTNGLGGPRDYKEAAKWWRKAAEQGHPVAQRRLGYYYEIGKGVPKDIVQAHKWYNLSASRFKELGNFAAHSLRIHILNSLEKSMTPAQIAEAKKLAREWKPKTWKELSQQN